MRYLVVLLAALTTLQSPCGAQSDPLTAQVTIYRDTCGVPHIVGESEESTLLRRISTIRHDFTASGT